MIDRPDFIDFIDETAEALAALSPADARQARANLAVLLEEREHEYRASATKVIPLETARRG